MKQGLLMAAAAMALTAATSTAQAASQIGEYLSFSGFGTLGAVQTNTDEAKYVKDRQGKGGADKTASIDVDSNLGVQLTGTATPWLSATVQVLAFKRDKGYVEPQVEWAYVTGKPLDSVTLRLGRIAPPIFAISDSRSIGYANTWVRAPNEVYGLNLFRRMEGLDVTYNTHVGPAELSATGFAGKSSFVSLSKFEGKGEDMKGVNLQAETDWATFRLGWMTTQVVIPALLPPGQYFLDPYTFSGAGVIVDRDNIVVQAEYVKRRSERNPVQVNLNGWYVMGGYRFGKVLPYAMRSVETPKLLANTTQQRATAVGVRWDAFTSAALKLQLDRVNTNNSKGQSFTAPVSQPVTVVTATVDFTF